MAKNPARSSAASRKLATVLAAAVILASCASAKASVERPSTTARLAIVSPTPGAFTSGSFDVKLALTGGRIVPASTTTLVQNGGHIHAYVDDRLVSMAYTLDQRLTGLAPGPHSFRAEFVAADHLPFKNRVVADVLFDVRE